ncbi:MAG: TRAP transporter large permease subunit [Treponema sp.]|jgi:tripartite ATP-independent transporter DctM subunit|nr:TRAP transporter large permease subunit [Treponema sp.]
MKEEKTQIQKAASYFELAEHGICFTAIGLLILLPIVQNLLGHFNIFIPASRAFLNHFFLVLCFFAAMITTKSREHISITIVQFIKNEKLKHILAFACGMVSVFVITIMAWDSVCFMVHGLSGKFIGFIPDRGFAAVMPLAYTVIVIRFILQGRGKAEKTALVSAFIAGSVCALPAIVKIIWGDDLRPMSEIPPEPFYSWVNSLYDAALNIRFPLLMLLILAALSGTPIFVVIGGIALIMLQSLNQEPDKAPTDIYYAFTDGADIIAIPLFTLTGFFLSESKAGERLVHTFRTFFSWLPGGLIIVTVVICAFFTSFTGASGVTILALGGILYIILADKSKYPEKFSIGLLTSSGGIGLLFPPSLPIILAGSTIISILHFMNEPVDYSIIHFFLGALIPGIIMVLVMIIFGTASSMKVKPPKETFSMEKAGKSLKASSLEILLPFLLLGGYFSGFLNLVEVSAVSVIYVFIVEVFVHKDIKPGEINKVFLKAIPIIGGILVIIAMSRVLSYPIVYSEVPKNFALWMQETIKSKFVFLFLLNLALLVTGCLMDIFSAILVVLPLIIHIGYITYGIDPVHLGVIFIINLEVGFLTPPVGLNLFLASYRFEKPFMSICRYVLPFLLIQFAVVLLVTYIPWLSTFLPSLF